MKNKTRAIMIISLAISAVVLGVYVGLYLLEQEYPRLFAYLTAVALADFATWGPLAILDAPEL